MRNLLLQVAALSALFLLIFISFYALMPSVTLNKEVPETDFSTYRALAHVKKIAQKPHYTGSANHSRVRSYIVNQLQGMGLMVHTQSGFVINSSQVMTYPQNIVALIPGSDPRPGSDILILGHYDSEPHSSFGAADDASAVGAILESTAVFLAQKTPHKNNVIIVFTDAEEIGLLGARLFVEQHPLAENVGLVLNFEARGTAGPSNTILETNAGNAALIQSFAQARPLFPMASSLMYEIYKNMPNDTDATVFREEMDIPGFFFAFIDGHYNYHTANDKAKNLDINSLAHQGSYLTALLPFYANADLTGFEVEENQVYFNLPFLPLVHYPYSWMMPLLILAWVLFLLLTGIGLVKKRLSFSGIGSGFLAFLSGALCLFALGYLGWKVVLYAYPQYREIQQGFPYNGQLYLLAFVLLGTGVLLWIYHAVYRPQTPVSWLVAPLFFWLLINTGLVLAFKGASYFILPVILIEIVWGLMIRKEKPNLVIVLILSAPAVFVWVPLIRFIPVALGMKLLYGALVLLTLVFGLLLPVFKNFARHKIGAVLFLAAGCFFLGKAHLESGFSKDRQKPNSLVYVLDKETHQAVWKTYDRILDDWTGQKLTDAQPVQDASVIPSKYGSGFRFEQTAPVKPVPGAKISVHKEKTAAGKIQYHIEAVPEREMSRMMLLSADQEIRLENLRFNGLPVKTTTGQPAKMYKTAQQDKQLLLVYYLVGQEPLEIDFELPEGQVPALELLGISNDLLDNPWVTVSPRDDTMIPRPFVLNDAVITRQVLLKKE